MLNPSSLWQIESKRFEIYGTRVLHTRFPFFSLTRLFFLRSSFSRPVFILQTNQTHTAEEGVGKKEEEENQTQISAD